MVNVLERSQTCTVIAAIDMNHNGDLDLAKRLIDSACQAKADAVKFQKRTVGMSGVKQFLDRPFNKYPSLGSFYREIKERLELSAEALSRLYEHSGSAIGFVVAPYDLMAYREIQEIPWKAIKIDSSCAINLPLLAEVAGKGGKVIASTGGCSPAEITDLVATLGKCELTLMHSLAMHPFLGTISDVHHMEWLKRFGCPVGYSDNEPGFNLSLVALALGARIIEKPLTLDRSMEGPHHTSSLTPPELERLVKSIQTIEQELQDGTPRRLYPVEMDELESERPSIVAACPITKGTKISHDMLTLKPPGRGLSPKFVPFLVGRQVLYDVDEDELLTFGVVDL